MNKQIEEMAKTIQHLRIAAKPCLSDRLSSSMSCLACDYLEKGYCQQDIEVATGLYDKSYRKASDVVREIFDEIDRLTYRYMNDVDYSIGDMVLDIADLKKKYEREGEV